MKNVLGFIINAALSILMAIAAVYLISFLNMVPHSMQVDLPHYMYPTVMPASGTKAYDAEKARERLGKKLHQELVELGIEEEETTTAYVPTPEVEAGSRLTRVWYPKFAAPLGYSLVQQGYFTVGSDGEAKQYFSPGPDGAWHMYDPKTGEVSGVSDDAAMIPCSCEDLITFTVSRDPAGTVSSDMAEILTESAPGDDLGELALYGVKTFGSVRMTGLTFASLLQYQAAGRFLGFYDETRTEQHGRAYYLSGDDKQYINRVSYYTYDAGTSEISKDLESDVISTVMEGKFYTYDPETKMVGETSFWPDEYVSGMHQANIAELPEGYTGPPVVGKIGEKPCCVFAGKSDVQMMDLSNGELREIGEMSLSDGDTYSGISFVFGTDRLVLFYTTDNDPETVQVSEVLYSSLEV